MADRVRAAPARKRAGARRPARKKRRMRRLGIFGLAVLAASILGFLTKRVMIPSAVHYIAYRAPDQPPAASQPQNDADDSAASTAKSNAGARAGAEQLTPGDRRELDAIIKRKSR